MSLCALSFTKPSMRRALSQRGVDSGRCCSSQAPVVSRSRRLYRYLRKLIKGQRSSSDDAFLRTAPRSEWINNKIATDRVLWLDRALKSSSGGYFSKSNERFNVDLGFLIVPLLAMLGMMWFVVIPYTQQTEERRRHTLKCLEEAAEERRRRPPPPPDPI